MSYTLKVRWKMLTCRHRKNTGTTIGGYKRCYECGKDYLEAERRWVDHIYMLGYRDFTKQDNPK